jgi:hypothetical protein
VSNQQGYVFPGSSRAVEKKVQVKNGNMEYDVQKVVKASLKFQCWDQ